MKISVFGCGYVGLTTAVGLAEMGHEVMGFDIDKTKIDLLLNGTSPFYEPGLQEMMRRNIAIKRLTFTLDSRTAIQFGELIFSAVGTPPRADHQADLTAVLEVARMFGEHGSDGKIFVNKSTVPVGTSQKIIHTIAQSAQKFSYHVISNPEFLREGTALQDFFSPDRIIVGLDKSDDYPKRKIIKLYGPMAERGIPILFTDMESAEIIKYASNAFLATKISFINELAHFCELTGADIQTVANGMGYDKRIGSSFLQAGLGFGGSCLPKDLAALIEKGKEHGVPFHILHEARKVNELLPVRIVQKSEFVLGSLEDKTISIWGLSFKPQTDDLREAPSLKIISLLLKKGAHVRLFDPVSMIQAKKILQNCDGNNRIEFSSDMYNALKDSDALFLITEWDDFLHPDYAKMKKLMSNTVILDGRNALSSEDAIQNGFTYLCFGKEFGAQSRIAPHFNVRGRLTSMKNQVFHE